MNDLGDEEEGGDWSIFDSTSRSLREGWKACVLKTSPLLSEDVPLDHNKITERVEQELS